MPWLHRPLLVALALVLAALPALAHATPPDPSWIPGLYDDADDDDVIVLVTSATGDVPGATSPDLEPAQSVVAELIQPSDRMPAVPGGSAEQPRAPPAP